MIVQIDSPVKPNELEPKDLEKLSRQIINNLLAFASQPVGLSLWEEYK